jgi:hypothetical protein
LSLCYKGFLKRMEGGGGFATPESKISLLRMEERRNKLLKEKEESWRLKSIAIWLASGDENTKFFQAFAKGRRCANTIWHLRDQEGNLENSFEGMARLGKNHFQELFRAENQATIEEVVQMAQLFPRFVDEEDNRLLMEEVLEEELKEVLHSFQKDKIPGPDGWTIEFFLGLYDFLGHDMLKLVEDTISSG